MSASNYFTIPDHLYRAKKEGIAALKPESVGYKEIERQAAFGIKELLGVPTTHEVLFLESMVAFSDLVLTQSGGLKNVFDASKLMPYLHLDFIQTPSIAFLVNDGFGIPSEVIVLIIEKKWKERWHSTAVNVPAIDLYLLAKVCEDLQRRGMQVIRQETEYKAAVLNQMIHAHPLLQHAVIDEALRAKTIIGVKVKGGRKRLLDFLNQKRLLTCVDEDLGDENTLFFVNYPAHSKEQVEMLSDVIAQDFLRH